MNFIEGRLDENGAIFRSGDCQIDVSRALSGRSADYAAKNLTIGIRPEDLHTTSPDRAWVQGEAEFVEDLGSDKFVHFKSGKLKLVARVPAHIPMNTGEILYLAAEPIRLHLFYQGKRINES